MNRFHVIIVAALAVGLGIGIARATQPPPHLNLLPFIANGQAPETKIVKLLDGDYTLVSLAASPEGCLFAAAMDRAAGNLIVVGQIANGRFFPVDPPQTIRVFSPFTPEGEKHAGMDLLILGDTMYLSWTTRPEGATSGGFDWMLMTTPLPACEDAQ